MFNVHGINQNREEYHQPKEVEKFSCEECGSQFKLRKDLSIHLKFKHKKNETGSFYSCEQCPSKYNHKKSLNAHIKLKHGKEKEKFECQECERKFELKRTLNRHLLIHD